MLYRCGIRMVDDDALRSLNKTFFFFLLCIPKILSLDVVFSFCNLETSRRRRRQVELHAVFNPRVVNFLVVSAL